MDELNKMENEIDVVGVGTHLVTCTKQPSLGCVYKLVEVRGRPRMKISEDPKKSTVPGRKSVYRLVDAEGHPFLDLVCLAVESPPVAGSLSELLPSGILMTPLPQSLQLRSPVCARKCLSKDSAAETRAKVQSSLQTVHPRHKRLHEPDSYTAQEDSVTLLFIKSLFYNTLHPPASRLQDM
ncbi:Nicotinate phosphoribosyltransferase [Larimichthys crocea]|uniref:Uncharacterized protein n=1 Tax=Larimichthys crocea TaxID=215358 RepID=A0ACD3RMN5_LARCR|nr:Nicotinate phosphoribosyltransferase [Larimichthys crocea]